VLWLSYSLFDVSALLGLILASWIILSTLQALSKRVIARGFMFVGQSYWGMIVAHLGVAVSVIGVAVSTAYGVQDDVQMSSGKNIDLVGYSIEFIKQKPLNGPNYQGTQAEFRISHQGQTKLIYPEKRVYTIGQMAMTESAIDVTPFRDIYVALGEPLADNSWSVRLYYKPLVRWIWTGGFIILVGGFLALTDRRYYRKRLVVQELKA
jgi:cytochrome c-type biogenesis protein CcmF